MKRIFTLSMIMTLLMSVSAQVNFWRGTEELEQYKNVDSLVYQRGLTQYDLYSRNDRYSYVINNQSAKGDIASTYGLLKTLYVGLETIGYRRTNDFGISAINMLTDSRGQDVVAIDTGYNWFKYSYDDVCSPVLGSGSCGFYTHIVWHTLYRTIVECNRIIKNNTDDVYAVAQAKALRAFCYMQLAQVYQFAYDDTTLDLPCVPLVTEFVSAYSVIDMERATVAQVYQQIKSDLDAACQKLQGFERTDKTYINQAVAFGLRARMNLLMHNWDEAASDAEKALQLSGAQPLTIAQASVPGFAMLTPTNVLWCK